MNERVLILSDLHMGHPVSRLERVSALKPLLDGVDHVIWNGDTWQELTPPFRQRSAHMLAELDALCGSLGVKQSHLPGNHDPGWPGSGWMELDDGNIIISHGDALFDEGSPWKREILLNQKLVRDLWSAHPDARHSAEVRHQLAREIALKLPSQEHPEGRSLLQRAWDAALPPRRAIKIIESWHFQSDAGNAFCDAFFPNAQVLVVGHFHQHGAWRRGQRLILNTGSFMNPAKPCWVEWHQGWLSFGEITESPHACHKGKKLGVWRLHND